ncbi:MAG: NAD(P)-binding domain-containing protein, partial [Bacteroidales bacterium]|nr:NAD(P)-binding domain-containing protein [Bacteroidales bacterium]
MKTTIGFIGGGRITKVFLEGFKNKNVEFESVKVYEPNSETLDALANDFPAVKKAETPEEAAKAKVVVIAV